MIKRIAYTAVFFTLILFTTNAQDGSYSPYSYFKFGEEVESQSVRNYAMGHLNFYNDTLHFNLTLPSALARLKLVNYAVAASFDLFQIQSSEASGVSGVFSIPYVSLGIPVGNRAGLGFGFKPYSTSGYLIKKEFTGERVAKTGEGGLNRVFVSAGFNIFKGFNLGVAYNYYFGNKIARFVHHKDDVFAITRQVDNAVYRGSGWHFSADYTRDLQNNLFLQGGILYTLPAELSSENTTTLEISDSSFGTERIVQSITLRNDTTYQSIPSTWSIGVGIGKKKHWFAGIEWQAEQWGAYRNDFFTTPQVSYRNASVIKFGGFWIPDQRPHVKYYKRITYSAGFYHKNGDLLIDNQPVNEFGISFGLSLPMNYYFSNVNLGFEYVKRGDVLPGMTEENIIKFKIGLSFKDKWFIKRKIY